MPTGDNRKQIPGSLPVDANGNPIQDVVPGSWGDIAKYPLTVSNSEPRSVWDLLLEQHTGFPSVTTEIRFWSLLNFSDTPVWVGADDVAPDEDYPLPALADGVPGYHAAKDDLQNVFVVAEGSDETTIFLHLHGKNVK